MRIVKYLAFLILALLDVTSASLKFPRRVVSVGDVHGDLDAFVSVLLEAKIIEEMKTVRLVHRDRSWFHKITHPNWRYFEEKRVERYRWIAGDTVLIQTGDMMDRGKDTIAVYALLRKLQKQAKKAGGAVIPLLGNHEVMNICGDFRYVQEEERSTFAHSSEKREVEEIRKPELQGNGEEYSEERRIIQPRDLYRRLAFSNTGFLGKYIRRLDSVVVVGGTVYSHAGLSLKYAQRSVASINKMIRAALNFKPGPPGSFEQIFNPCYGNAVLLDEDGPLWNRIYNLEKEDPETCTILEKALKAKKAKRMVIGHNAQENGQIREFCNGKLFLIDVGMSRGVNNNPAAALEMIHTYEGEGHHRVLKGTKVNPVYAKSRDRDEL